MHPLTPPTSQHTAIHTPRPAAQQTGAATTIPASLPETTPSGHILTRPEYLDMLRASAENKRPDSLFAERAITAFETNGHDANPEMGQCPRGIAEKIFDQVTEAYDTPDTVAWRAAHPETQSSAPRLAYTRMRTRTTERAQARKTDAQRRTEADDADRGTNPLAHALRLDNAPTTITVEVDLVTPTKGLVMFKGTGKGGTLLHDARRGGGTGWSAEDANGTVRATGKRTARDAAYALARALHINGPLNIHIDDQYRRTGERD